LASGSVRLSGTRRLGLESCEIITHTWLKAPPTRTVRFFPEMLAWILTLLFELSCAIAAGADDGLQGGVPSDMSISHGLSDVEMLLPAPMVRQSDCRPPEAHATFGKGGRLQVARKVLRCAFAVFKALAVGHSATASAGTVLSACREDAAR
jgi:hypothetical protein